MNYGWEIAKIFFYLALVLGIIYLISIVIKRGVFQQSRGQYLQLIEQLYFAPKKGLVLVKVKDKVVLLTVSDSQIDKLDDWSLDEFAGLDLDNSQDFKGYLQQLMGGNRRDPK